MFKSPEKLREEFDEVARRLENTEGEPALVQLRGNRKADAVKIYLSSQLPVHGKSALEVGSGLGSFTCRLAEHFDRVVALDLSPEMVRVARKNTAEFSNIEFMIADVNTWNVPAGEFDCVVSITTLHHMPIEPVLAKMKDALRPGGLLLIGDFYEGGTGSRKGIRTKLSGFIKKLSRLLKSNARAGRSSHRGLGHDADEPYLPLEEVRRISEAVLPGAKMVTFPRHFALTWTKP